METFWGMSNPFASSAEKRFDRMVREYGEQPGTPQRATAEAIWKAVELSPDLKDRMFEAAGKDYLRKITPNIDDEGAAEYSVRHRRIGVEGGLSKTKRSDMVELIFELGHEIEHARSAKGFDYVDKVLDPRLKQIAEGPPTTGDTRDYTPVVADFVQHKREDEGRAHLGGFNALASYVREYRNESPKDLMRDLYEAHPDRMADFIDKKGTGVGAAYAFKDGLHPGKDLSLPSEDPRNIAAMTEYYADKAQIGEQKLNYRGTATRDALKLIDIYEDAYQSQEYSHWLRHSDEPSLAARRYTLDFDALGADPAKLGKPGDGIVTVRDPTVLDVPSMETVSFGLPDLILEPLQPQGGQHDARIEPPLFRQALDALERMPGNDVLGDAQERRNVAASLAVEAQDRKLTGIDQAIVGTSGQVIAVQGELHSQSEKTASVMVEGARRQPAEENLARLPTGTEGQGGPQPLPGMQEQKTERPETRFTL